MATGIPADWVFPSEAEHRISNAVWPEPIPFHLDSACEHWPSTTTRVIGEPIPVHPHSAFEHWPSTTTRVIGDRRRYLSFKIIVGAWKRGDLHPWQRCQRTGERLRLARVSDDWDEKQAFENGGLRDDGERFFDAAEVQAFLQSKGFQAERERYRIEVVMSLHSLYREGWQGYGADFENNTTEFDQAPPIWTAFLDALKAGHVQHALVAEGETLPLNNGLETCMGTYEKRKSWGGGKYEAYKKKHGELATHPSEAVQYTLSSSYDLQKIALTLDDAAHLCEMHSVPPPTGIANHLAEVHRLQKLDAQQAANAEPPVVGKSSVEWAATKALVAIADEDQKKRIRTKTEYRELVEARIDSKLGQRAWGRVWDKVTKTMGYEDLSQRGPIPKTAAK